MIVYLFDRSNETKMTAIHIMVDLETWGRTPGSDIRSIGATVFDPVSGFVGMRCPSCINVAIDCVDCLNTRKDMRGEFYIACDNPLIDNFDIGYIFATPKYPLTRDPETVQWWNDQSAEAQAAFENPIDIKRALEWFSSWLNDLTEEPTPVDDRNIRLWALGPQFDISILDAAYRVVGLPVPWHYRSPRDVRTITDAANMTRDDFASYGTAHNALDDAIAQAMTVCEAYRRLGIAR